MKDTYVLSASILHRRSSALLDAFEAEFAGSTGAEVTRRSLCSDIELPYDSMLLARAQVWAESCEEEEDVVVEDSLARIHSPEDCRAAAFCRLVFPECELRPPEQVASACGSCGGYVETPAERAPEHVEFDQVGEVGGSLYFDAAAGEEILAAGLQGAELAPWFADESVWRLQATVVVDEVLIEAQNVLGLAERPCEECSRTACRFHLGPTILTPTQSLEGLDVVGTRYLNFQSLAFSPRAAGVLLSRFSVAELWEPVRLS